LRNNNSRNRQRKNCCRDKQPLGCKDYDFNSLIKEFSKKLYILEEYEATKNTPVVFQSGLQVLKKKTQNKVICERDLNAAMQPPRKSSKFHPIQTKHLEKGENTKKVLKIRKPQKVPKSKYENKPRLKIIEQKRSNAFRGNKKGKSSQVRDEGGYFDKNGIKVHQDKTVSYVPWNRKYPTIYSCIEELSRYFELSELFPAFEWQHFESFLKQSLQNYGYYAIRTFRFQNRSKRYEVDVIGRNRKEILYIDAKHWSQKTASPSALMNVAVDQAERAKALVQNPNACGRLLQRLNYSSKKSFSQFKIFPVVIVSSTISRHRIVNGVPVLSFAQFNEFLNHFHALREKLQPVTLKKAVFQKRLK